MREIYRLINKNYLWEDLSAEAQKLGLEFIPDDEIIRKPQEIKLPQIDMSLEEFLNTAHTVFNWNPGVSSFWRICSKIVYLFNLLAANPELRMRINEQETITALRNVLNAGRD